MPRPALGRLARRWRRWLVAWVIQNYTRLGRHIYALGGGEELAALSGISIARVRIATFTLAGAFYALGGVLAPRNSASATLRSARGGCSPP